MFVLVLIFFHSVFSLCHSKPLFVFASSHYVLLFPSKRRWSARPSSSGQTGTQVVPHEHVVVELNEARGDGRRGTAGEETPPWPKVTSVQALQRLTLRARVPHTGSLPGHCHVRQPQFLGAESTGHARKTIEAGQARRPHGSVEPSAAVHEHSTVGNAHGPMSTLTFGSSGLDVTTSTAHEWHSIEDVRGPMSS